MKKLLRLSNSAMQIFQKMNFKMHRSAAEVSVPEEGYAPAPKAIPSST